MKKLAAGSEIDAWCTKCRMDLLHRIVAMVKDAPKRVICTTCNSEHNYRAPKNQPKAAGRVRKEPSTRAKKEASHNKETKAAAAMEQWESRIAGQPANAFAEYAIARTFGMNQLVMHKKFGEGFVVDTDDTKVTIVFRDGPRVLAMGVKD